VIDLDAAFGEEFLDVAVGQSVAQAPAHRYHDHVGREPESGERRTVMGLAGTSSCIVEESSLPDDPISQGKRALPLMTAGGPRLHPCGGEVTAVRGFRRSLQRSSEGAS
jgi:hypothetical protein